MYEETSISALLTMDNFLLIFEVNGILSEKIKLLFAYENNHISQSTFSVIIVILKLLEN